MIHVKKVTDGAIRVIAELSRLMTNTGGPTFGGRKLYYNILESIIGYGSPIWAKDGLKIASSVELIKRAQRAGLNRVAQAYCTVSRNALCAITGILPLEITLAERPKLYEIEKVKFRINETDDIDTKFEKLERQKIEKENIKKQSWQLWQEVWNDFPKAIWTKRLIPDVKKWSERKFGYLNYRLSQFLTGHGVFNSYRNRIGKSPDAKCWYGCDEVDDPEHTFFKCTRWATEKFTTELEIDETITVGNFENIIIKSKENWIAIDKLINSIIKKKEVKEREIEKIQRETCNRNRNRSRNM